MRMSYNQGKARDYNKPQVPEPCYEQCSRDQGCHTDLLFVCQLPLVLGGTGQAVHDCKND